MQLSDIPGLDEAVAEAQQQEAAIRNFAMEDTTVEVAGVECRQMTLRHLLYLSLSRSPFICGGAATPEAIIHFFWIVSPQFVAVRCNADREAAFQARASFIAELVARNLPFSSTAAAIAALIDDALLDSPASSGSRSTPISSFAASMVHEFASAYRWQHDEVLDSPIARLYQYLRHIIISDYAAKGLRPPPFFNSRSDKVRRKFVNAYLKRERQKPAKRRRRK